MSVENRKIAVWCLQNERFKESKEAFCTLFHSFSNHFWVKRSFRDFVFTIFGHTCAKRIFLSGRSWLTQSLCHKRIKKSIFLTIWSSLARCTVWKVLKWATIAHRHWSSWITYAAYNVPCIFLSSHLAVITKRNNKTIMNTPTRNGEKLNAVDELHLKTKLGQKGN